MLDIICLEDCEGGQLMSMTRHNVNSQGSRRALVDTIVIDSVQKPSEN